MLPQLSLDDKVWLQRVLAELSAWELEIVGDCGLWCHLENYKKKVTDKQMSELTRALDRLATLAFTKPTEDTELVLMLKQLRERAISIMKECILAQGTDMLGYAG